MRVLKKLLEAYGRLGYRCFVGNSASFFGNNPHVQAAHLVKDGTVPFDGGGIAPTEIAFFEELCDGLKPRTILVIGNSFGWSTLALGLVNPEARIVSIDPNEEGNEVTRRAARELGLQNVVPCDGYSPTDTKPFADEHLGGPADLIFIDAIHTDHFLRKDFDGCLPISHERSIFVMHDVLLHGMTNAFDRILADHDLHGTLLHRTPSGIGVACQHSMSDELDELVCLFREDELEAAENFFDCQASSPPISSRERVRRAVSGGLRRLIESRFGEIPAGETLVKFVGKKLRRAA